MNKYETEIKGLPYDGEEYREEYLKELGDSLRRYIDTGVKNQQLDELLTLQVQFKRKYHERFDVTNIIKAAIDETRGNLEVKYPYFSVEFDEMAKKKTQEPILNSTYFSYDKKESQIEFFENFCKNIQDRFLSIIKDVAYLSHVNMLYELYERQQKSLQEQKEYEEISRKYQNIAEITQMLSEKKKMDLNELQQQFNSSEEEILYILLSNSQMFNIRNKKDTVKVSLSPKGKKFNNHLLNINSNISNEAYNELIYKNCNMLIESLENSCEKKVVYQIKLEGIKPDALQAIEYKYYRTANKLIAEKEDMYIVNRMDLEEKTERMSATGEKVIYKIPRE